MRDQVICAQQIITLQDGIESKIAFTQKNNPEENG